MTNFRGTLTSKPNPADEHRFAGMILAASGHLPPVAGAIAQEVIDLLAVLNALRAARSPVRLTDYRA